MFLDEEELDIDWVWEVKLHMKLTQISYIDWTIIGADAWGLRQGFLRQHDCIRKGNADVDWFGEVKLGMKLAKKILVFGWTQIIGAEALGLR